MNRPIPSGYMTAEELRVKLYAHIEENAELMKERMTRKKAYHTAYPTHA
jgi:hypothetical protein